METVSIRDLRGASLRKSAVGGKPLAITNHRVLIGIMIPVAVMWTEHLIDYNWPYVQQSITEGEQAINAGGPLIAIDDLIAEPDKLAVPLVESLISGTTARASDSQEGLQRLQALLHQQESAAGQEEGLVGPSVRTVRIADLSAGLIGRASEVGEVLAITHDRELIGIIIPITRGLVEFLIESNVSRVLYNIGLGEKQIMDPGKLATLDDLLAQATLDHP